MAEPAKRGRGALQALVWAVLVGVVLLVPLAPALADLAAEAPGAVPLDKLVHVGLFVFLGRAWLAAGAPRGGARAFGVMVMAVAYGAALEVAQPIVGARTAEAWDVAADALGVAVAALTRLDSLRYRLRS